MWTPHGPADVSQLEKEKLLRNPRKVRTQDSSPPPRSLDGASSLVPGSTRLQVAFPVHVFWDACMCCGLRLPLRAFVVYRWAASYQGRGSLIFNDSIPWSLLLAVSGPLWNGVGIGLARRRPDSNVTIPPLYGGASSADTISLVSCSGAGRWWRLFPDSRSGGGSGFEAAWLAAAGWRKKFLQSGGLGNTGLRVTGHMRARSSRQLIWFSCFTSSGGSALVDWFEK